MAQITHDAEVYFKFQEFVQKEGRKEPDGELQSMIYAGFVRTLEHVGEHMIQRNYPKLYNHKRVTGFDTVSKKEIASYKEA